MKTEGLSFYFVLYVVAIITVFAITVERDRVLNQRDEAIAQLVSAYVRPLVLSSYVDTARFFIEPTYTMTRDSIRIRIKVDGPLAKNDVIFNVLDSKKIEGPEKLPVTEVSAVVRNEEEDGLFLYRSLEEGIYEFSVSGYKRRIITDGDSMRVAIGDTSYVIPYNESLMRVDRDTALLVAKVTKSGVVPPQLTLSVQETQENWVLGPPYKKKIFVGGIEDLRKASFSVGVPGRIEAVSATGSYVTLVWDRPTLGRRSFTVASNANRGFGEKDRASVTLGVEVFPATFISAPFGKAYWGIPYQFDGQLVGLNPLDLTVEASHDGQSLGVKPAVPKVSLTPDRTWNSLLFKVLYRDVVVKEHRVPVTSPPPPQIRWVQQNLDRSRNVFTISVACSDPTGGPVRLSLLSQPSGIARLDKVMGTAFTVTVNLEGKPPAVFIKLSATDQYGGQSVSTKQFNIPQ